MDCDFKNCMFWIGDGCIDEEEQLTCSYMKAIRGLCKVDAELDKVSKQLEKAYQVIGELIER